MSAKIVKRTFQDGISAWEFKVYNIMTVNGPSVHPDIWKREMSMVDRLELDDTVFDAIKTIKNREKGEKDPMMSPEKDILATLSPTKEVPKKFLRGATKKILAVNQLSEIHENPHENPGEKKEIIEVVKKSEDKPSQGMGGLFGKLKPAAKQEEPALNKAKVEPEDNPPPKKLGGIAKLLGKKKSNLVEADNEASASLLKKDGDNQNKDLKSRMLDAKKNNLVKDLKNQQMADEKIKSIRR